MSTQPTYQGVFCLLHLNEPDKGYLDKGPSRRTVGRSGIIFTNPFDGPFEDIETQNVVGCVDFPQDPPPGGTNANNLISIACENLLSWQNDKFTIEFWFRLFELPSDDYDMIFTSMGSGEPDASWELRFKKVYGSSSYQLIFNWEDTRGFSKTQTFEVVPDLLKLKTWQHFAFAYGDVVEAFDYWIDGVSYGPFPGVQSGQNTGPWNGVNIRQSGSINNVLTIGNVHPGGRNDNQEATYPDVFKGQLFDYRLTSNQTVYPIGADYTPRTAAIPDYEATDPDGSEEIVIERAFVNGLPKIYVDEFRHFPKLAQVKTSSPQSGVEGFAEGELYFQRRDPQRPELFLWIWINVQAENETPVYRWVPWAGVEKGKINPVTGNPWRSRFGNKLGEPF
jgi:hypothetical protein